MDVCINTKVASKIISTMRDFSGIKTEVGSFIRLDAKNNIFALSATDEQTTATIRISTSDFPIEINKEGSTFVRADSLIKIISSIKPMTAAGIGCKNVVLKNSDNSFSIDYDTVYTDGSTIPSERSIPRTLEEKFSSIQETKTPNISIKSTIFKKALAKVMHAVGSEGLDRNLNLIVIDPSKENKSIKISATNGAKLVEVVINSDPELISSNDRIFLPAKIMRKIFRIIEGLEEDDFIEICLEKNSLYLHIRELYMFIRTPTQKTKYPDCSSVFSGEEDFCTVDKKIFVANVREMIPVSESDGGRVEFNFNNNTCNLSSTGYLGGKISGIRISGLQRTFKKDLNINFVLDILRTFDSEVLKIQFYQNDAKLGFEESDDFSNTKTIIMPLR